MHILSPETDKIDPDQMPNSAAYPDQKKHSVISDLGLHCLRITLLGVSGVNGNLVLRP